MLGSVYVYMYVCATCFNMSLCCQISNSPRHRAHEACVDSKDDNISSSYNKNNINSKSNKNQRKKEEEEVADDLQFEHMQFTACHTGISAAMPHDVQENIHVHNIRTYIHTYGHVIQMCMDIFIYDSWQLYRYERIGTYAAHSNCQSNRAANKQTHCSHILVQHANTYAHTYMHTSICSARGRTL